ncbi:MAG TPA: hypothetical protein VGJ56_27655 [Reyranella sp.]|jgi:hypothetical protein
MPTARSKADIMCLAVYTLVGGRMLRGFIVTTVADRLGISFDRATDMADTAHQAGLVRHEHGTVTLTGQGLARGATLTPSMVKKPGRRLSEKRSALRAKPRPRQRAGKP